mmetsp:Transcript_57304/g.166289  ORF Transcript_57304/g.166289 Transcript_57304/m.166289 type:complete len:163 (-) Transcript_57304:239-727(-)
MARAHRRRGACASPPWRGRGCPSSAMGNTACCTKQDFEKHEALDIQSVASGVDGPSLSTDLSAGTPSAKAGPPELFHAAIDRSSGDRLGVDIDHQDGKTLLVCAVGDGLVKSWNDEHPDEQIRKGDRIVEVNGVSGNIFKMVEECKKKEVLRMGVVRRQNEN